MTSLSLLDRAKQGNAEAIAALMNSALQSQSIWVKAALDADCLQVMLKSPDALNQATCMTFLHRGLLRLQPAAIAQVRAYAWRTGDAFPLWIATVPLERSPNDPLRSIATPPLQQSALAAPGSDGQTSGHSSLDNAILSLQTQAASAARPPKRRFELFKMGFVLVLVTMIYFVVTGV